MKNYLRNRCLSPACAVLAMASWANASQTGNCQQFAALESYANAGIAPHGATCSTFVSQSAKTGGGGFLLLGVFLPR